ncbi:MAG: rhomboid family intramembrane serine protease [Chromatiales bacterium]|nr:rhomboid family intramembrane serine protease [Chromatiales bacterium]
MAPDDWTVVFETRRRWECQEQALVLDALGIPHLVADGPGDAALLLVPAGQAGRARQELRLYAAENRRSPPKPGLTLHGHGLPGVAVYVLVLIAAFLVQGRVAYGVDWLEAGSLDGAAVRDGEWWRVITALTLHGDAGHLVANLVFGAFFGAFAGQYLGSGVAWATILLAAGAGNGLDLFLLPATHRAIGASTAVFAALGLIAALMWRAESRRASSWARRYAPLIGAVVLLAYIGTGDAQTDAVAHLTGFIAGIFAGASYDVRRPRWLQSAAVQVTAGLATLALLAACWWLALGAWRAGLA